MGTVLHIGMDKTGTTAIQSALAGDRDRLAANGVLYPDIDGRPDHRRLVERPNEPVDLAADRLVLSHESFLPAGPERVDALLHRLPRPVDVHVWVRNPGAYLDAAFRQRLREASSERRLALLLRIVRLPAPINPVARRCVARHETLSAWKERFGDHLHVHDYERDRADIVSAFRSRTGVPVEAAPGTRSNRSPSLRAIHALAMERSAGRRPDPNDFLATAVLLGEVATAPIVPDHVAAWCSDRCAPMLERLGVGVPDAPQAPGRDDRLDREAARDLAERVRSYAPGAGL